MERSFAAALSLPIAQCDRREVKLKPVVYLFVTPGYEVKGRPAISMQAANVPT